MNVILENIHILDLFQLILLFYFIKIVLLIYKIPKLFFNLFKSIVAFWLIMIL